MTPGMPNLDQYCVRFLYQSMINVLKLDLKKVTDLSHLFTNLTEFESKTDISHHLENGVQKEDLICHVKLAKMWEKLV